MSKEQLPYAEAWRYCQETLRVVPPVLETFYIGALLNAWDIRHFLVDLRTGYTLQVLQSAIAFSRIKGRDQKPMGWGNVLHLDLHRRHSTSGL